MSYVWLTWLADAVRAEGVTVKEVPGWQRRGRTGKSFNPYGVEWHHTGTTTSPSRPAPTLNTIINGRSDLGGPLAQALIGYDGVFHCVAAGRANHCGKCGGFSPFPAGDGNAMLVGWEIDYNGTQAMSQAQADTATRATAAVLKRFKRGANYTVRHEETSVTGKWDCGGVSGAQIRSMVGNYLASGGDDDVISDQDVDRIAAAVWQMQWGRSGKSAMNYIDTIDSNVWAQKPWQSANPASTAIALQQIHGWVQQLAAALQAASTRMQRDE